MEQPIVICAFDSLQLSIGGEPPGLSARVPRRPLDLLKALLAGGGRALAVERLTDTLWPDADGDAAYRALVTNVYRLRHLLRNHEALIFTGSQLMLDPSWVRVDAWDFERDATNFGDPAQLQRAIDLYRGPFLRDDEGPFAIEMRERLRRKFIRAVLALGSAHERSGDLDGAIERYETALDIEPHSTQLRASLQCALTGNPRTPAAIDALRRFRALESVAA